MKDFKQLRIYGLAAVLLVISTAPTVALADNHYKDNYQTQTFRPAINGKGLLTNEGDLLNHLEFTFSLVANYSFRPVVLRLSDTVKTVRPLIYHRTMADFSFAIGLYEWVELGFNLPVIISQDGFQLQDFQTHVRKKTGLGDFSLTGKVAILRQHKHGVALNFGLTVTFPTSNERSAVGDNSFTFNPMFNFSWDNNAWYIGVNLGAVLRRENRVENLLATQELKLNVGVGYTWQDPGLTLFVEALHSSPFKRFWQGRDESPLEFFGGLRWKYNGVQLLAGAGVGAIRGVGTPVVRAILGLQFTTATRDRDKDGIPDHKDRCPTQPEDKDGFEDNDGCPEGDNDGDGIPDIRDKCPNKPEDKDGFKDDDGCPDPDNDGDGIPDTRDKCPNEPEDKDGFKDNDGCPDPDNDNDGICDPWVARQGLSKKYAGICKGSDKCPNEPEDKDGFQDDDGCPDYDNDGDGIPDTDDKCPNEKGIKQNNGCPKIQVTKGKIVIRDKVFFKTGSSRILKKSFPLLEEIAKVLQAHPEILLVQIEGHTDSRGNRKKNIRLSKARAKSVQRHLVRKLKIAKERLVSKGFGPDKPLDPANNDAAWSKNRRVEFTILKRK